MQNNVHSERAHSVHGASSAERWMACPASVKLIEKAPPQKSSPYAAEGTCAHELAEVALLQDKPCTDFIGEKFEGWEVTEEMADYVQIYVDYVRKASEGEHKEAVIEEKFDLSHIREGMFGSNDACIMEFMGTLEVIDLKYGKGIPVSPEENKQLMYYALGAAYGSDFKEIKLTIIQPRVEDPIKSWTTTIDRLLRFEKELGDAVDATLQPQAKAKTGPHCRFCAAKAICTAKREEAQALARVDFEKATPIGNGALPAPKDMDEQTLNRILTHSKDVKEWLDSVAAYAQHRLENGHYVKGYKLVRGRSNRKVESEVELHMAYGDDIYTKKLKTLAELKKIAGKDLDQFLYKPEGKLTMAPEHDKRPEVEVNSAINDFNESPIDKGDNFDNFEF